MAENSREPEPESAENQPGKNQPEIKRPNEPEPEIKNPERAQDEVADDDRFQSTDN
ncbi:MAG TPA: hypothetical protein VGY57_08695 [Vicinamibacterales bacterium]|nr:hypothetical protein [Vicinamibacterales bacterium]